MMDFIVGMLLTVFFLLICVSSGYCFMIGVLHALSDKPATIKFGQPISFRIVREEESTQQNKFETELAEGKRKYDGPSGRESDGYDRFS